MPSTYTVNLGIEKPATGEQSGTWGDTTNVNFDILDQAINGAERVTLTSAGSSGSPNALNITNGATSDGRNKWIEFYSSGDLGGSAYVQLVPDDAEKIVFIRNSLASSRSVLLFQGTYNSGRDLEIPAGVDMVVKFDGGGASAATVTDVFTKLRATEITTPTLTATTADINGGTIDNSVIGGSTAAAVTGTTVVANTSLNIAGDGATVTGIKDEDDMSSNSATKLATQQSIKAYVDSQVGTVDTWAEVLANGATSGSTNPEVTAGQALKTNTINETTAGSGVTIDSVLLKDDVVNATDIETSSISANDGTAAATIANSTGNFTITNFISNSVDIGGGAIDGTNIGASSAATGAFTTLTASGLATLSANLKLPSNSTIFGGTDTGLNHYTNNYLYVAGGSNGIILKSQGLATEYAKFEAGQTVFNEDSNDTDFRVESNGASHMLFVDAGNNRVGIGESSPDTPLHLTTSSSGTAVTIESTDGSSAAGSTIILYKNSASPLASDGLSTIKFRGKDSGGATNDYVQLVATLEDPTATAEDGSFTIQALTNGTNRNRLTVNSTEININESGQDVDFRVESDNKGSMFFIDASTDTAYFGAVDNRGFVNIEKDAPLASNGAFTSPHLALHSLNQPTDNDGFVGMSFATSDSDNYGFTIGAQRTTGGSGNLVFRNHFNSASGTAMMEIKGGSGIVINDNGADIDFRVESDSNTHMLFVDASQNSVGINTNSPSSTFALDVVGSIRTQGAAPGLTIYETDASNQQWIVGGYGGTLALRDVTGGTYPFQITTGSPTNSILIQSSGVTVNDNSADQDFRVESDNLTHALYVNAGDGEVSVNSNDINACFGVAQKDDGGSGDIAIRMKSDTNEQDVILRYQGKDNSSAVRYCDIVADFDGGNERLQFKAPYNTTSPQLELSSTHGAIFNEGSANRDFRVESDGNANMLFVDAGNNRVGIGNGAPNETFSVRNDSAADMLSLNGASASANTNVANILFRNLYSAATGSIAKVGMDTGSSTDRGDLVISTAAASNVPTERIRVTQEGYTIIPGGVTLGTSAGTYAAANTLDDYEEGTWTPVLTAVSGTKTWSYSAQRGVYTKVGNLVTIFFNIQLTSNGSGTDGNARITGLPFTMETDTSLVAVYGFFWKQLIQTADVALEGRISSAGNFIDLLDGSSSYPDITPIDTSLLVNDRRIRGTMQYRV